MRCHIVGSNHRRQHPAHRLDVLGAHLEQMPPSSSLKHDQNRRVARVREILRENPDYHWMRQYHDDIHYLGYEAVAELIHYGPVATHSPRRRRGLGASTGALAHYLSKRSVDVRPRGRPAVRECHLRQRARADPEIIIAGIGSSTASATSATTSTTPCTASRPTPPSPAASTCCVGTPYSRACPPEPHTSPPGERREEPGRTALFIAADTGHRYVDTVFARHREAGRIEGSGPRPVRGTDELTLPGHV